MLRVLSLCALCGVISITAVGCARSDKKMGAAKAGAEGKTAAPAPADAKAPNQGEGAAPFKKQPAPQAGLLTAGSFDDNAFPDPFHKLVSRFGQIKQSQLGSWPGKLAGKKIIVSVTGKGGAPLGNARLELSDGQRQVTLLSRSDGRAIFLSSWDGFDPEKELTVTVTPPDGSKAVKRSIPHGAAALAIAFPEVTAPLPRNLDLVIVLDTTGSMGDEIAYLKSEIESIVGRIQKQFPQVNQRFSLILYRDKGDEYVVKSYPFTSSVAEFQQQLVAQNAAGGGDYPEAVHRGLEEALKLQWRTADTARVLFLIGDAPPHSYEMEQALAAVAGLREKGVAMYPLACSGYDEAVELIWRASALLTGGQFLFLTDDSGIGDPHAEPRIPFYQVEHLNYLMARMIAGELAGQRIAADPADILRTVGEAPAVKGKQ